MRIDLDAIRAIDALEDRNEKVYQAALYYAKEGFPVIPIPYGQKHINSKTLYTSTCSARVEKMKEWFDPEKGKYRGWNLALGCGDYYGKGGIFVVDIDTKYDEKYKDNLWGHAAWESLSDQGAVVGPLQKTPSGGSHAVMLWQENLTPSQNRLALGIDTRGGHPGKISSHIVAWPSVVNNEEYRWLEGGEVGEAPQWLISAMGVSWKSQAPSPKGGRGNEAVGNSDVEERFSLEQITGLLDGLHPDDLISYDHWLRVGQAIHSQHPDDGGLELWDMWSQRGKKYEPGECHVRWKGFNSNGPVRMATLLWYIQEFGTPAKVTDDMGGDESQFDQDPVDEYNRKFALVLVGEGVKVVRKEVDRDFGQTVYKLYHVDAFRMFRSNDCVEFTDARGQPKRMPKFDIWVASPSRQTYDGMLMHPGKPPIVRDELGHKYLNRWAGFTVQPAPGDWSLLKRHIHDNLCRGVSEHYEWLMDWLADMFQEPHDPKGCAVILGGIEGAGKGTLANFIADIFGVHASIISNSKHLQSQFNDMIMDSVFLFADEVIYAGNHEAAQALKAMVTEKKNTREAKFGSKEKVDQFLHIMMSTNNEWKIAAGPESRRWFILQVNSAIANEVSYFAAIREQMNELGGKAAMLHELLNREITSNLRMAPVTEELKAQRMLMQTKSHDDSLPAWLSYILETGRINCPDITADMENRDSWPKLVSKAALLDEYITWSRTSRPRAQITPPHVFFQKLYKIGFAAGPRTSVGKGSREYTIKVPAIEILTAQAEEVLAIQVTKNEELEEM